VDYLGHCERGEWEAVGCLFDKLSELGLRSIHVGESLLNVVPQLLHALRSRMFARQAREKKK
jgi:hypothetical protein